VYAGNRRFRTRYPLIHSMQFSFGCGESPADGTALGNLGQSWINGLERIPDADHDGWKKSDYRVSRGGNHRLPQPRFAQQF
jgi:hypothetical protein